MSSAVSTLIPVTLPRGRARLETKPTSTGSEPVANRIGIVLVAEIAAWIATSLPPTSRTATLRPRRSATMSGNWSNWPSAQRYSMATLRPSAKPTSPRPRWNPAMRSLHCVAATACSEPITGIADCCALAATGQAAAAPPRSVMTSRRSLDHLVGAPEQSDREGDTQRLGSLEIDDQLDLRGLLYGQVGWLLAPENATRIDAGQPV